LAERESEWSRRYGKNHLAVINTRNQMNEIKSSILDELRRIAESYKSDYEIAKQRLAGIEHELGQARITPDLRRRLLGMVSVRKQRAAVRLFPADGANHQKRLRKKLIMVKKTAIDKKNSPAVTNGSYLV